MYTLVLKIRINSDKCIDDKDEIYKALRILAAFTHIDIEDDELRGLIDRALELGGRMVGEAYDIVED